MQFPCHLAMDSGKCIVTRVGVPRIRERKRWKGQWQVRRYESWDTTHTCCPIDPKKTTIYNASRRPRPDKLPLVIMFGHFKETRLILAQRRHLSLPIDLPQPTSACLRQTFQPQLVRNTPATTTRDTAPPATTLHRLQLQTPRCFWQEP